MEGSVRFLARIWRLVFEETEEGQWIPSPLVTDEPADRETTRALAKTTAKVAADIERLQFNTAISALMILVNHLTSLPKRPQSALRHLCLLLAPFAPHLAEEIHQHLGGKNDLSVAPWPTYHPADTLEDSVELPVQVNSKVKGKIHISPTATRDEIEKMVRAHADLPTWIDAKQIQKIIVVPGRIVNLICT